MKPPRPDSLLLRVPIFVCLIGLIAGNCLTYFVKNAADAGRWVLLLSLVAGVFFSLLYMGHLLFGRLHQRLSDLVALLGFHALMLTTVVLSFDCLSGGASSWLNSTAWNILLLAAASLALLLRANVLALVAANCLPEEWTISIVVPRRKTLVLREERRSLRWYICAFFWASPLAWWTLFLLAVFLRTFEPDARVLASLIALFIFLQLRALLGGFACFHTAREWWARKKPVDAQFAREARWFLMSSGLPAAGMIAFYAFCFAALRIHQDALAARLEPRVAEQSAALLAMQPPPRKDEENPWPLYAEAQSGLTNNTDEALFTYQWDRPDAIGTLQSMPSLIENLYRAAAIKHPVRVAEYGEDWSPSWATSRIWFWSLARVLMVHGRFAARNGDWDVLLKDAEASLAMADQLHQQPNIGHHYSGNHVEDITITVLIAALLRDDAAAPPDSILERTQQMLRQFAPRREGALTRLLQIDRLRMLRHFDANCGSAKGAWPGEPEVCALALKQPLLRIEWRQALVRYYDWLETAATESPGLATDRNPYLTYGGGYANIINCNELIHSNSIIYDYDIRCDYSLADAAIAASRYNRKYHRWPAELSECVPEFLPRLPVDPYQSEQPVRFAADPPRTYSAGPTRNYAAEWHEKEIPAECFSAILSANERQNRVLFFGPCDPLAVSNLESNDLLKISEEDEMNFLVNGDDEAREMALKNVSKIAPYIHDPKLIPYFVKNLDSSDTDERIWAAYILGRAGHHASNALARVSQEAERASDPTLRYYALEAARRIRTRLRAIGQYSAIDSQ